MRLEERSISLEVVKSVIKNPITNVSQNNQVVVTGLANGRSLRVIYRYEKRTYIIITAYYED